jgi:hypothetical protein
MEIKIMSDRLSSFKRVTTILWPPKKNEIAYMAAGAVGILVVKTDVFG